MLHDESEIAKRYREHLDLLDNLRQLRDMGAVIVLVSGDDLELSAEAIDNYLTNEGERAQMAANEAYYGGDGPAGCYGPDDRR